jgi:polysaccharide chain length determinant protein (PEP-CTERM system associated)
MQDEVSSASMFEQVRAIWSRRKWLMVMVFPLPLVAALSLAAFLPSLYKSTASVLVQRQQVPENMVQATVTSDAQTRLQTISQEILSRPRLEALISRFGLYTGEKGKVPIEELISRMRKDIELEIKSTGQGEGTRTYAFALSFKGSDPDTVAKVTNTLASFFIEANTRNREQAASGTSQFLKIQLDDMKRRLDAQEANVSEYKKRHIGGLPQQMDANLAASERLNTQLILNSDNQTRLMQRRERAAKELAEAEAALPGSGPDAAAARLAQATEELRQLRIRFSDKYPDVARLKEEIAGLERELAEDRPRTTVQRPQTRTPVNPIVVRLRQTLTEIDADMAMLKTEEKRLRNAIATYLARVESAPQREQEFNELFRDYQTSRELYASLLKRYEEAQIAESMEQRQKGEQFRVIEPAFPSASPTSPNRLRLILLGFALSLGLAGGVAVIAEQLNASFHSVDDLRNFTSVAVLTSIPRIVTPGDTARDQRRARLAALSMAIGIALIVTVSYLMARGNEQLVVLLARGRL